MTVLSLIGVCTLTACNGSVQLCGRYACVFLDNRCEVGRTCNKPRQCESAGSIRDRAPRIINELRAAQRACSIGTQQENRTRVIWDESLASASGAHSRDMAQNRFESFNGTNGTTSSDRVSLAGFNARIVAESINSGAQTSAEAINEWLDIQTDCEQILTTNTSRIGMACALSNDLDNTPYWSLLLAAPETIGIQQRVTNNRID